MNYSIYDYGTMITDAGRMDAYTQALQKTVKPGSIVLDIGTGTGIFALIACELGAKQVYAIETNSAIALAQKVAATNNLSERIQFIQDLSTKIDLPQPADVIISDLRGVLPLHQHHIPSIVDARTRLLATDGVLIPQQDTIWAALVNAPELHRGYVCPWGEKPYGFTMTDMIPWATNTWSKARITPEQLIVEPQVWATLDYTTIENPHIEATLTWHISQESTAHGIALWFDATIAEGIGFSNAPDKADIIYGKAFFPWLQAVELESGDRVEIKIQANLVNEDYVWSWHTQVFSQDNQSQPKVNFSQSTFFGNPLPPAQLRKRGNNYVPQLNQEGKIAQIILQLMAENKPLCEIAQEIIQKFPQQFTTWQSALSKVAHMSQMYSD